jgi:hypothetical protein
MPPTIAYDLTGLCFAPPTANPRGIDRVDVAFATHFFESWKGDCFATLPTPWGVRCFDRAFGLRVVQHANAFWNEYLTCDAKAGSTGGAGRGRTGEA